MLLSCKRFSGTKSTSDRDRTGPRETSHVAQHCLQVQGSSARGVSAKVGGSESEEALPGKDPGNLVATAAA